MRISTKPRQFSVEDFRDRAAERGQFSDHGEEFGDHSLNPHARDVLRAKATRDAAVLIPVVDWPDAPTVLLTRRPATMRTHSGQIAFPGGRIDPEDADPENAAIRECEEETGIEPGYIEIVGRLPEYMSGTGFRVFPILSVIRPGYTVQPNPHEVDAVFEVPLAFLMNEANHSRGSRIFHGHEIQFYEIPYQDWHIWGLTAGIIRLMYERLYV